MYQSGKAGEEAKKRKSPAKLKAGELVTLRLGGGSPVYVKKESQAAQRKFRVSYNLLRSMMQKVTLTNLVSHYW